jgi:GYF domain 2
LVAQLSQLVYRCPKCGGTFDADGEGSPAAGCPTCRESPGAGWYLKVRGEVVGPVPFESLPQQVNASAVLVRKAGETEWTPVTSVLPEIHGPRVDSVVFSGGLESEEGPRIPARRLVWPIVSAAVVIVGLAGGWAYHRSTLEQAVKSQAADGDFPADRRTPADDRSTQQRQAAELGQTVDRLEKRVAAADYRRQLLIEVTARQERKLSARIQELKTATRSRRFRRFRGGFNPPDEDAAITLMTDFRRRLAHTWSVALAKRRDAAAELAFCAAEVKRITGAAAKLPLQPHDRQLLKQNGVKFRTQYNAFYTTAHKELTLYMEYATADEIALYAAHSGLSFPAGKLPLEFAAAVEKLRKRGSWMER